MTFVKKFSEPFKLIQKQIADSGDQQVSASRSDVI